MNDQTYVPEMWVVSKDAIYAAREALKIGIEHANDLVNLHDITAGRFTKSNLARAICIEDAIKQMEDAIEGLKKIEVVK